MGFFDIDGKFFRGLTKAGDFFILGVLAVVFSIPVITIGPTLTAVFYVALKLVKNEEGYIWKGFWKSWKQNFKQGFLIELMVVALAAVLFVDFRVCAQWASAEGTTFPRLLMFGILGFGMVLGATVMYVFPVLARFDNTVIKTIKNSLVLCMHHLPQTIVMLIATYGLSYFSLQFFTAFIVTIPVLIYGDAFIMARIFGKYSSGTTAEAADSVSGTDNGGIAENAGIAENDEEVER